ncbi:MAG: hypothetical protein ACP5HZ_10480, partial [Ferrimicrobium sp.]
MLLNTLLAFVEALRAAGVSLGPSSVIDAAAALVAVDLLDREVLRAALAATLVKEQSSLAIFYRLFDVFFSAGSHAGADGEDEEELIDAIRDALLAQDYER